MADETDVMGIGSKYRVAFDLALRIAHHEQGSKDRAYWLKLYVQCRKVVQGYDAESAQADDDE